MAENILYRMNCTRNAEIIEKCKKQLKEIGYKVIWDGYIRKWILVW